ncbi:MAG: FKBP-type peptidyl-prolyl cis-trans isomerase [Burkholderiaceae bacterium]
MTFRRSLAVRPLALLTITSAASCCLSVAQSASSAASTPSSATSSVALVTASGLSIAMLRDGTGPSPQASDRVKVHYRGTLPDGKEFDSSYRRGEPATFGLARVIPCWTEGVQRMKVGGKARLTCPPAIAYGERGAGGAIPPNTTLVFEVELLEIVGR